MFDHMAWRTTGTCILRGLDDIQMLLDDQIVKTQSMRASPYIGPFEDRVRLWEAKLNLTQVRNAHTFPHPPASFTLFRNLPYGPLRLYLPATIHTFQTTQQFTPLLLRPSVFHPSTPLLYLPHTCAGDHGRVAQVPVRLAVPGAHLRLRRHHAADAE